MSIVLRIVAVVIGLAVVLTILMIVQFALLGALIAFARSGTLGLVTITGWVVILTAGPVATVQLWRLRRIGLSLAAILCAIVFSYYVLGLFLRLPEAPLMPILGGVIVNGVLLALLLSPAARKVCVREC